MSPDRHFQIKRALLRALSDCRGFAVVAAALHESAKLKVDYIQPTTAELDTALREIDTERLAAGIDSERGLKYRITDNGRAWLAENS